MFLTLRVQLPALLRLLLVVVVVTALTGCNSAKSPTTTPPDAIAPLALNCPSNVRLDDVKNQSQTVDYGNPSHTGGVDPVLVSCTPASGTIFSLGSTSVSCTGRDSATLTRNAACSFTVTLLPFVPTLGVTRFMAFGDSITRGEINNNDLGDRCAPGPESAPLIQPFARQPDFGYPGVLDRLLAARYAKQTFTVVNEGAPIHTATEDTGRFAEALAVDQPEVVLLLQGIIDLPGRSPVPALRQDVQAAKAFGVKAILLSTLLPVSTGFRACDFTNAEIRATNDDIRALAASENIFLVDSYAAFVGRLDTLMGPDGLHPTAEGQEVIAQLFFDVIKRNFEVAASTAVAPARAEAAERAEMSGLAGRRLQRR